MKKENRNNEVFLKILDLEITREQMGKIMFFAFVIGMMIGAFAFHHD